LPHANEAIVPGMLGVALVVTVAVGNPLLTNPAAGLSSIQFGFPTPDAHAELLDRIISLIPPTASVLTTAHLFPQVSSRPNAYVLPTDQSYAGDNTYIGSLNQFINDSSYVLLDYTLDGYDSQVMQGLGNYSGFGIEVASQGIFLLQRGWTTSPLAGFAIPSTVDYPTISAATSSKSATLYPSNGTFAYSAAHAPKGVGVWNGPDVNRVVPGSYVLTVNYLLDPKSSGTLMALKATETPLTVTQEETLITSTGHHYTYNFSRAPSLPPLGPVDISATTAQENHTQAGSISMELNVSSLLNLAFSGSTGAGTGAGVSFWIQFTSFSLTWIGPPPSFVGGV